MLENVVKRIDKVSVFLSHPLIVVPFAFGVLTTSTCYVAFGEFTGWARSRISAAVVAAISLSTDVPTQ